MSNLITINDTQLEQLTYHDQPVVTFEMIANVHGVPVQNVHKAFARHQDRFEEGKHVYRINGVDAQLILGVQANSNGLRLFTQKGYLLLVKPMKDEQSWQVQERMIDEYFAMRQALQVQPSYIDAYPELKAISTLVLGLAEQRHELDMVKAENACILAEQLAQKDALIATQQQALENRNQSTRAESKADMALDEAHRMTLEEFILINGLIRQFPHTKHAEYSRWLGSFCVDYDLKVPKAPVLGKSWDRENAYPLQALAAWLRYEQKRPQQIVLVNRPRTGA